MKTAISIEDDIFTEAELTAKEMGLSRSKFYSKAILEFSPSRNINPTESRLSKPPYVLL
jgi:hypothetical protein